MHRWELFTGYPDRLYLVNGWQQNIDAIAPMATELLSNGTITGFFLGDELVRLFCVIFLLGSC